MHCYPFIYICVIVSMFVYLSDDAFISVLVNACFHKSIRFTLKMFVLEIQYLTQHINSKWLLNVAVDTLSTVLNCLGRLTLGLLTILIAWLSEVGMTALLVFGVKLDSRSTCNGIIIMPYFTATCQLVQHLLTETSILTLCNNTTSLSFLKQEWARNSGCLRFLCCWLLHQQFP
jgi:hypothetical protein